jgi:hypothetical protein
VLTRHEEDPETWRVPLTKELGKAGASDDRGLVSAAEALLRMVDEAGARTGKYAVDARGAQGLRIGDRNTQQNVFRARPGGLGPPDTGAASSLGHGRGSG